MSLRHAFIALAILPLAACEGTGFPGMRGAAQPDLPAHSGPPSVSPLEVPIETGASAPRPVSTAEARTLNTAAFSASGQQPFWAVDAAGRTAIYKSADNQRGRAIRVDRLTFAEGVEYVGIHAGRPFALTVRAGACTDSVSGKRLPMTATLKVSGRMLQGCAGPATAEVATAVAAIKAPAPVLPKPKAAPPKPPVDRPAAAAPASAPPAAEAPVSETLAPESPAPEAVVPAPALQLPSTPPTVTAPAVTPADAAAETE